MVGDNNKKTPEPRIVFIKKSQLELGVHLCGGNLHGVFVAEMEDDSPAKGPDGLVPGDLILEVSSELLSAWALASRGKMIHSCQQQDF